MGKIYKVAVTVVEDDEYVGTVLELAAPIEMLRQFAPSAVAAALGTTAMDAAMTTRIDPEASEAPTEQKERRRRRTKAEMEAARAAESNTPEERATPEPASIAMSGPVETAAYNPFGPK